MSSQNLPPPPPNKYFVCIPSINPYFFNINTNNFNEIKTKTCEAIGINNTNNTNKSDIKNLYNSIINNYDVTAFDNGKETIYKNKMPPNDSYLFIRQNAPYAHALLDLKSYYKNSYDITSTPYTNLEKLNTEKKYTHYRTIRGDGNCYFYAYICSAIERIAFNATNFDNDLNNFKTKLTTVNNNETNTTDYINNINKNFKFIDDELENILKNNSNQDIKLKAFIHLFYSTFNKNPEFANSLQMMLRIHSVNIVKYMLQNFNNENEKKSFISKIVNFVENEVNNFEKNNNKYYTEMLTSGTYCLNVLLTDHIFDNYFFNENNNHNKFFQQYINRDNIESSNNIDEESIYVSQPILGDSHYNIIYKIPSNDEKYKIDTETLSFFAIDSTTQSIKNDEIITAASNFEKEQNNQNELETKVNKFLNNTNTNINDDSYFQEDFITELKNQYDKLQNQTGKTDKILNLILSGIIHEKYNALQLLSSKFYNEDFYKNISSNLEINKHIIGLTIFRSGLGITDYTNTDILKDENDNPPFTTEQVKKKLILQNSPPPPSTQQQQQIYYATFKINKNMNVTDFNQTNENDNAFKKAQVINFDSIKIEKNIYENTIYKMSYIIDETTNEITINYNP